MAEKILLTAESKAELEKRLEERNTWQGRCCAAEGGGE